VNEVIATSTVIGGMSGTVTLEQIVDSPRRSSVSVVSPVFNEAGTLREFVSRLAGVSLTLDDRYTFEFILVDDGSTDETLRIAQELIRNEPRLRVIELRRNFGQTAALQAGLQAARGSVVISLDSDLQHFPEDIPQFLARVSEGYDLVCGWRYDRREGIRRRWPSRVANALIRRVAGVSVHDFGTTFRAYRADLLQHIQLLGEQHRFVPALAALVGARIAEVKIQNIERPVGKSHYGLARTFNVLLDILLLYFLRFHFTKPLKVFGKLGLALMAVGGLIASVLLSYSWVTGVPTVRAHGGWFLLSALLILMGLQTLLTGVLAEILIRVYYRTSGSAGFFIRKEWTADVAQHVGMRSA
jgi:glycosyltransferase involved in cell wall biosynthesis